MTTRPAIRFYAYSQTLGRKRLHADTAGAAIEEAQGLGAVNVQLEEGPVSKPLKTTIIWRRYDTFAVSELVRVMDANGTVWNVPKSALLPVGE